MRECVFLPIRLMASVPYRRSLRWDYSLGLFARSHRDADRDSILGQSPEQSSARCLRRHTDRDATDRLEDICKKRLHLLVIQVRLDQNKRFGQVCRIA